MPKSDDALVTEAGARRSGVRIQRDDARVDGAEEDAATTWGSGGRSRVNPGGHSATGEVAPIVLAVGLGIVAPQLLAGLRIERDGLAEWRREVHHPADDERCGLELGGASRLIHLAR